MREKDVPSFPFLPILALALLVLSLAALLQGEGKTGFSAVSVSSRGYLVNKAGTFSSTAVEIRASGEPVPVKLYFSNPALEPYVSLASTHASWNGGGFSFLSGKAILEVGVSGIEDESLFFQNETIWVEALDVNSTIPLFVIPGSFATLGREPPTGVPVGFITRNSGMRIPDGRVLPVEVSVWIW